MSNRNDRVPSISDLRKICQTPQSALHDSLLGKYFGRKLSIYFTKLFLYTKTTGNQITIFWCFLDLAGAALFALGLYWGAILGAILIILAYVLDGSDGEVSRYRKTCSIRGEYLDRLCHDIAYPSIFIGLTFGAYSNFQDYRIFFFGFSAAIFFILMWLVEMEKTLILHKDSQNAKNTGLIDTLLNQRDNGVKSKLTRLLTFIRGKFFIDIASIDLLLILILIGAIFNILQIILIICGTLLPIRWFIQAVLNLKYSFSKYQ